MRPVSEATKAYEPAGELLKVLSAPARLAIVVALAEGPRLVNQLVGQLDMSQPLVSQHLRVLRSARLVDVQRQGREAVVFADRSPRGAHRRRRRPPFQGGIMTTTGHAAHDEHPHQHGPDCGHAAAEHDGHIDYIHDGHAHAAHDDHYDEHPLPHVAHSDHDHVHGPDCGHAAVEHDGHIDYIHDGHAHAAHDDHYDEH